MAIDKSSVIIIIITTVIINIAAKNIPGFEHCLAILEHFIIIIVAVETVVKIITIFITNLYLTIANEN